MTFHDWTYYLTGNKNHFGHINWKHRKQLTSKERSRISSSIQQFQRGENSEGKSLMNYTKELGDAEYVNTMKLFIHEEQRHAMILSKFMKMNGICKIKSHWIDDIFRSMRKLANLENSITVLITAEIIATVYYHALKNATRSGLLADLCKQILIDEEMHINFQSFTLKKFYDSKTSFQKSTNVVYRKILMAGTILVVWISHMKVINDGGYSLKRFWALNFKEFYRSLDMIQGKTNIKIRIERNRDSLEHNSRQIQDDLFIKSA